jgi:hypothetical protein
LKHIPRQDKLRRCNLEPFISWWTALEIERETSEFAMPRRLFILMLLAYPFLSHAVRAEARGTRITNGWIFRDSDR